MHLIEQKLYQCDKCYFHFKEYRNSNDFITDTREFKHFLNDPYRIHDFTRKIASYEFIVITYLDGKEQYHKTIWIELTNLPDPITNRSCDFCYIL